MQWKVLHTDVPSDTGDVKKILLENRNLSKEEVNTFFSPKQPKDLTLDDVAIDVTQVQRAVERIERAKENKEEVVVFGDYDADGVCATAILWETLFEHGVKAIPFIPHREKHGYGMTDRSLDALLSERAPKLIITVDNGIVAQAAVERLNHEGIDVIITDHHAPEQHAGENTFPNAYAIVHSTHICGATVAWFLAREINRAKAEEMLDLCAIATVADQMVLTDANRSFAHFGIEALKNTTRVGLTNLFQIAAIEPENISTRTINFAIGPRINAMGRIGSALEALRALCIRDQQKSMELIQALQTTNVERQTLTVDMLEHARQQAASWKNEHLIVVASEEFHDGVIGLIAGKLVEEFYKPAIAISVGEKFAKASARSVEGVNIVELIREVRDELLEVGGHPMAAGFGLLPEKVETVKARLQKLAQTQIHQDLLTPSLTVECLLPSDLISLDLYDELQTFDPFGNGNPEPVFGIKNMEIVQVYAVGKEGRHLKLSVRNLNKEGGTAETLHGIGFGLGKLANQFKPGMQVDIAGTVSMNEWNGRQSVQVVVKDVVAI